MVCLLQDFASDFELCLNIKKVWLNDLSPVIQLWLVLEAQWYLPFRFRLASVGIQKASK